MLTAIFQTALVRPPVRGHSLATTTELSRSSGRAGIALGELGEHGVRSTIGGCLGEVLARCGKLDEAESVLDEAIGMSTPDDWVTVSQVDVGRAFVASARGEHEPRL